jgi:hypothetical protein
MCYFPVFANHLHVENDDNGKDRAATIPIPFSPVEYAHVHVSRSEIKTVELMLCSISTVLVRSKYACMSYRNMSCAILVILYESDTLMFTFKIGIVALAGLA